jgi:hypothetical protein
MCKVNKITWRNDDDHHHHPDTVILLMEKEKAMQKKEHRCAMRNMCTFLLLLF